MQIVELVEKKRPPKPVFQPMTLVHHNELSVVWPADKCIPSLESRRTWALARNILPTLYIAGGGIEIMLPRRRGL
jgi:hypothetical protein